MLISAREMAVQKKGAMNSAYHTRCGNVEDDGIVGRKISNVKLLDKKVLWWSTV